ncbi:MarR family winged helix-turn-helix transcriptional regulator [Sneathiella chinensis]|uniref:Transcriptional regulator n=1 Tax=Sneathiella chinensis TaxID=349750 RepID=A0ABQ5U3Y7_9PROT|nr:MarR family transcriptional regulator [Sneathiella chinensis]GLQ06042.1 transcriptional regulator [Sneathiella chinensis]
MSTAYSLSLTLDQLVRAAREIQFHEDLVPAQWEALRYLSWANRYSTTPGNVARFLGTTKGTASQTLRALESKGYLRRIPNPKDRRGINLTLTVAGRDKLSSDPLFRVLEHMEQQAGEEKEALLASLEKLLWLVKGNDTDRQFGYCLHCKHFRRNRKGGTAAGTCRMAREPLNHSDLLKICALYVQALPSRAVSSSSANVSADQR